MLEVQSSFCVAEIRDKPDVYLRECFMLFIMRCCHLIMDSGISVHVHLGRDWGNKTWAKGTLFDIAE